MSQNPVPLRIGTRGSRLARAQAELVARALKKRTGPACEIVALTTTGDRILDRSLADAGGKGLFTKEIEEALLKGAVDLAVHSMKDVPTLLPPGLAFAALLPREDPRDVFISHKAHTLEALPQGARIGTSSVRRRAQVARARPDLDIVLLRGNVDTRLARLDAGEMDAILLALAGLNRLGLGHRATSVLNAKEWLPALAQGAIGIEVRDDDLRTRELVAALDHAPTAIALACERAFQEALDGSCRSPIGGLATVQNNHLEFRGEVLSPNGKFCAETQITLALGTDAKAEAEAARAGREAGVALRPRAAAWLDL